MIILGILHYFSICRIINTQAAIGAGSPKRGRQDEEDEGNFSGRSETGGAADVGGFSAHSGSSRVGTAIHQLVGDVNNPLSRE
jgi:hypothetical protein